MFKISNTDNGVKAFITGFKTEELSAKIQECQNGHCSCNCDPQIMQKIENIEVTSEKDGTNIIISGSINAKELEPLMKECLL
ncbi:MAG: hypothetical protein GW906_07680 [Epsilonproteobacteria bacterium]|nr:hypothetical protein [Campylobacterota bacterium]OIO14608.1 MAG: hypothetical protein AUJ81_09025 [Helicobacteraceae bacterium CG1_02_36_14]PIP09564.1 MAG: hypothetical protein COX50_10250 [Sulfurimonas sp. CG23_combo_of_CG06-09_8_20_14_all_36_33]PIS25293.1 MAG: hypothetical protein COT46_06355 [Sulfurimonas sp. CG08_land_8_20_14_0_20_36_33]PIU33551.1 MAG: hypothetical protein COT05_11480 [Sulfurimonas sp. CG07_land_8_20_14_0_80_36_56]PIV04020.1 MAG: hypothetical protein COS56_05970 [Sulfur